jgi:kynurenine formamidase
MCVPGCHAAVAAHAASTPPRRSGATLGRPGRPGGQIERLATRLSAAVPVHTHVIDLTHVLTHDFPTYDGRETFAIEPHYAFADSGFNGKKWFLEEHTGTHFDAPFHASADGATADMIEACDLVVPLVVVDIAERAAEDASTAVTPDDIAAHEAAFGPIPSGACVAMFSGWDAHLRTARFRNVDAKGVMHFPGFHAETAALLKERGVKGLASDTLSLDVGSSKTFDAHRAWLPAGGWGLECVANLGMLPRAGSTIVAGVPKVRGATGGPARVFALI